MARCNDTELKADAFRHLVEAQALAALTVAAQALMGAATSKARYDEERLQQEARFVASLERSEPTARHRRVAQRMLGISGDREGHPSR